VKAFVAEDPEVLERVPAGRYRYPLTLAVQASRVCDLGVFRYILEQDPHINLTLLNEALLNAAMFGNKEMVGLLLMHGADPNYTDPKTGAQRTGAWTEAVTPLQAALFADHLDVAQQLVGAGAKPDIFAAAALGNVAWLRAILRKEPSLANWQGRGGRYQGPAGLEMLPIDWARRYRQKAAARVLLDYMESPKLSDIIAAGDERRVRDFLTRQPVSVRTPDDRGRYPLNYAIEAGELEIAKLLIDRGADVNAGAPYQAAIWDAVHAGDADAVKFLIDRKAKIFRNGSRPAFATVDLVNYAKRNEHPELVALIAKAEEEQQ
jgi:ankyrin repeat protein